MAMTQVTRDGHRPEQLRELALALAGWMDQCESARDMASLARQYRETIDELDSLGVDDDEDGLAQIISRRAAG